MQVTHDHSHVGWLRRKGELNEREARMHPRRNALQQALGAGNQFVEPPKKEPWGVMAILKDSEGNQLVLSSSK